MKVSFKVLQLIVLSFIVFSCSKSYKTIPIEGTSVKIKVYEKDSVSDGELMLGGKKKVRVIFSKITEKKFPNGLDFLVKSLASGNDLKIIGKYTFPNGAFGVSYTAKVAKPIELRKSRKTRKSNKSKKHYVFYYKKGNEYLRFSNNEYYNTDLKHFTYVKSVMASII